MDPRGEPLGDPADQDHMTLRSLGRAQLASLGSGGGRGAMGSLLENSEEEEQQQQRK